MHLPNHYVAVDREHKEVWDALRARRVRGTVLTVTACTPQVVLCIRGTMHWRDILTDLVADTSALVRPSRCHCPHTATITS